MPQSNDHRRPIHSNPTRSDRVAHAPYNFVPLPEKIVTVDMEDLPGHDSYSHKHDIYTGWFDCTLETCSPIYVRGMMTLEEFGQYDPEEEAKLSDKKTDELEKMRQLKQRRAHFYSTERGASGKKTASRPMIPGSSLRGMIRSLIEIVSYSRMRWVNDTPKFTFRAVAAPISDPLSKPYKETMGDFGNKVKAGYLKKTDDNQWEIIPALTPRDMGWPEKSAYLKVKEAKIPNGAITDFVRYDNPDYWPYYFFVSFDASIKRGKRGPLTSIDKIGDDTEGYAHEGTLVCTGSMIEGVERDKQGRPLKEWPRRNHTLILRESNKAALRIMPEVLQDYLDSLTPFQSEEVWGKGGLEDGNPVGAPVFYLEEKGSVLWFGHTPNFRIAALNEDRRATTPADFIPKEFSPAPQPDLAEAIFGWIEDASFKLTEQSFSILRREGVPNDVIEKLRGLKEEVFSRKSLSRQVRSRIAGVEDSLGQMSEAELAELILGHAEKDDVTGQRAGRVFFSDAKCTTDSSADIWYSTQATTPATLSSPKTTTFQHYFIQDKSKGHDPDQSQTLAHYAIKNLEETEIRGFKLYWHKGGSPDFKATDEELKHEKQLTRIMPVKPGVGFKCRVHFENLRDYELGALAWALQLPGDKPYRHKLGMGKPLGLGAVHITAKLYLTERSNKQSSRYARLFAADGSLHSGAGESETKDFIAAFEKLVLGDVAPDKQRLSELRRIQMLLAMLEWRTGDGQWPNKTKYMKIELEDQRARGKLNEYKNRPVLPDPLDVSKEK